ncbi:MAG: ATP-dependent DNA ligase [Thermodesulfovibrionales bacterium]|nr:ATP-dependent DNA ligase [Thermodesulfovibrionales bacterium]
MKFARLAEYFQRIEGVSKRLEIFDIVAELFYEASPDNIDRIVYLCQEGLLPPFHGVELGLSAKLMIRAISDAAQAPTRDVEASFAGLGDLGLVAEGLVNKSGGLTALQVYDELMEIARTSGKGSQAKKIELVVSLFNGLSPLETRYVTRFIIGKLRLGIGDPTILEAIAHVEACRRHNVSIHSIPSQSLKKDEKLKTFEELEKIPEILEGAKAQTDGYFGDKSPKQDVYQNRLAMNYFKALLELRRSIREPLERAYNICSDLGLVAKTFKTSGLEEIRNFKIQVGYPIRMALCERLSSGEEILQKISGEETGPGAFRKAAVEVKYDGMRCQIHKSGNDVQIFSRNLERMTHMFPEVVQATLELSAESLIYEGEALAYDEATGDLLPFQTTMQRRRKHNIESKAGEFPLKVFAFELLYLDGEDYTVKSYETRHKTLANLLDKSSQQVIDTALMKIVDDPKEINAIFNSYIEKGLEGIIAKRLDAPYIAGARNFNWIKLKRSYKSELADSIDVCIIGYYAGKGKRARFGLGALLGAVYEPGPDTFKSVSKIGTGFTEAALKEYFRMLDEIKLTEKPLRVDSDMEPDFWVEPKYVVTVTADEITRSRMHTAGRDEDGTGYALRFPRAEGLPREDKSATDATTVQEIIDMEKLQRKNTSD